MTARAAFGCSCLFCLVGLSASVGLPSTMTAGALTKRPLDQKVHFDDLQSVKISVPHPSHGQVLVKVAGSSVNPVDWKLIESSYAASWSYPHVFGRDCAGMVVSVGEGVSRLKVGDAVWADNAQAEGCYAEYVALNETIVGLAPSKVTLAEAAVLPLVSLTGLEAFQFAGAPWPAKDKTALVLGGSGGTGHVGVQLAKALGASKVITTCGTDHVEFCSMNGADQVIDYHKADWHTVIPARSVDVIYDTVALSGTGNLAYDVLRDGGHFITLLTQGLADSATAAKRPSVKQEFFLTDSSSYRNLDILKELVDAGKLRGHIEATFSLDRVAGAFNHSMGGHTAGKVSVVPATSIIV